MSRSFPIFKAPTRFSLELLLIAGIAIGILLRLLNLGSREFWYDEVLSLLVSSGQAVNYDGPGPVPVVLREYTALFSVPLNAGVQDFANVFKGLVSDVHPPLSFLFLHFWMRLFGSSEIATRGLIALISALAVASAYGLGRFLLGRGGGLILAALLATNPYYLSHSLNIRMYAPLVLWAILSAWAMLHLTDMGNGAESEENEEKNPSPLTSSPAHPLNRSTLFWSAVLIGSVAAGLLTQYLFAHWVITLGIFSLVFDRRRWWQHGMRLGIGVLLTLPWALWGTRQQLRNRPNLGGQFDSTGGLQHFTDAAQTLGNHLVLGDWGTSFPVGVSTVAGTIAIALLAACAISLWRMGERRSLAVAFVLGIVPLLLALTVDIVTNKFTVGFGQGRTLIFILPGCLLLIATWLLQASGRWLPTVAGGLLLLYLTVGVGDYTLRQRAMFHQVADLIRQAPKTPTLVAMNSNAWGHVLRLAYYTPPNTSVKLLARAPAKLAPSLEKVLQGAEGSKYSRLIFLDSAKPVWSALKTETQKQTEKRKIEKVLQTAFCKSKQPCKPTKTQQLSGTMDIDQFTVNLYTRSGK
ncbi:glycosyltransferase family 39 protein [Microseira wollei]|uniref:Glycosyltransferase RgtA/B/C/D-like domain-containing protein n=1 Tax=Microseira wollei NIES-4236 TaxID=2530354 RepID=A0AAV3XB75_9CYAN|nr:glycosyltransferase family 39 protein [Microseira wollei]GET37360.1 hypothetical protein MiSe_21130 [Microseira wollei NIES-4236]